MSILQETLAYEPKPATTFDELKTNIECVKKFRMEAPWINDPISDSGMDVLSKPMKVSI